MSLDEKTFWRLELPEKVQQWDIFLDVPFSMPVPSAYLKAISPPKGISNAYGQHSTPQKAKDGRIFALAESKVGAAMLLNYECDYDKAKRVSLANVYPIEQVPVAQRAQIVAGDVRAFLYLPALPGVGNAVVDFRLINSIPKEIVERLTRVASLSPEAKKLARAHMAAYFFRVEWPDDLKPPPLQD